MNTQANDKRVEMTLSDRLDQEDGWVYLTGMQALVRLPIEQAKRDKAAGLNTGGYISGYRGSPMGRYDLELWQADETLKKHNIVFQPGVNEDLAATATWGAQQVGLFPGATVDGVFSIWYGKTPGMDRAMDALRHANLAGTSKHGGSLMLVGDDHGAKSSTVAGSSDFNFPALGVPLLSPANAQEVLDLGLHGIAMSRFTSTIVGMKLVTDVVEGGGSVHVSPDHPKTKTPSDRDDPPSIQPYVPFLEQERLLWDVKIARALDYARNNDLNRLSGSESAKIGIVAAGKAWQDLNQALNSIGYDGTKAGNIDLRLMKIGMVWPLDDQILNEFASGLDVIIIVEEKRPILEDQIRAHLYGSEQSPRLVGKKFGGQVFGSQAGETAFPMSGEIDPLLIANVIARVASETSPQSTIGIGNRDASALTIPGGAIRAPSYCAGCPHGRSTQVIEGSRTLAGIGCHSIAMLRDPINTNSISHMGGEGAAWMGQFPFTEEPHVFTNMGDGTYFHSGLLAIRAAVAAKSPITYKMLHNGFVSMTGGQPVDGEMSPETMIAQLQAEGVKRIAWVVDDLDRVEGAKLGAGVTIHDRSEIVAVQQELRKIPDVTVLIFDQACANERRRQRKRGLWDDPDKRVFINPAVCEGCGDCSSVSACMAIEPLETPFGRKRQINQSSCNKDFSCVEGFCPSFVTISGARPRRSSKTSDVIDAGEIPTPVLPAVEGSHAILVAGIGGAGVVTIGQMLAVAGHADGYYSSNLDVTGMAQKYGAVHSHIKLASTPENARATRIATGEADTMIGCDLVVAAGDESLSMLNPDDALTVTDCTIVPTSEFAKDPDWTLNAQEQMERISSVVGDRSRIIDAQQLAEKILGDRVFANFVLVGAAWQQGAIPISQAAIERAIELNGVAITKNLNAFNLGRLAIADPDRVGELMRGTGENPPPDNDPLSFDQLNELHVQELTAYGVRDFVDRYTRTVARISKAGFDENLQVAVAKGYYKLLAHKDEWEVARLYCRPEFKASLDQTFEGDLKLTFNIGGWPFAGTNKKTGQPTKREVGAWILPIFGMMSRTRALRGTMLDPFRNTKEAKLARQLLANYEEDIEFALNNHNQTTRADIDALLNLPTDIRGYGHIREKHANDVAIRRNTLRQRISKAG